MPNKVVKKEVKMEVAKNVEPIETPKSSASSQNLDVRIKDAAIDSETTQTACNICGATSFKAGPSGRLSVDGRPPICTGCGSSERHRVFRSIFENVRGTYFKSLSCLMFTKDRSIAGGWFASTQYCGPGSAPEFDIQKLPVPNESVDVIVCNNVLAATKSYELGFKEIARVMSNRGFAFISFPNPHYRKVTKDWGHPKEEHNGNYRTFGEDIEAKMPALLPDLGIVRVVSEDPVTGHEDRAYIISKNSEFLARIGEKGMRIRFLQF